MQELLTMNERNTVGIKLNNSSLFRNATIFFLLLSVSFSVSYWAMAKYDVYSDMSASDYQQYIKMSKLDFKDVHRRFQYRVLMPFLVYVVSQAGKRLGVVEYLSRYYEDVEQKSVQLYFGVINVISLALTGYLLFHFCGRMMFSEWESLVAALLFLCSFYVVTYYTTPLIDSLSSFFMMAGFYAVLQKSRWGIVLSLFFGCLTKETIFLIPILIVLVEHRIWSKQLFVCVPVILFYAVYVRMFPTQPIHDDVYIFGVLSDLGNVKRSVLGSIRSVNMYVVIEHMQTFLFVWVLFFYAIFRCAIPRFLKRSLWLVALPFIIPLVQNVGANARVSFYLFPIVLPVAVLGLKKILMVPGARTGVVHNG